MPCPHSSSPSASPERCSLCIYSSGGSSFTTAPPEVGVVTVVGPRILVNGRDTGRLVDPKFELNIGRSDDPASEFLEEKRDWDNNPHKSRERAPQRCSFCNETGHNRGTCPELG